MIDTLIYKNLFTELWTLRTTGVVILLLLLRVEGSVKTTHLLSTFYLIVLETVCGRRIILDQGKR